MGNANHRKGDQSECQQENAYQVVRELAPRGEPSGTVKKRWQDHEKDQIRAKFYLRDARNKAQQQSADDKHDRVRHGQFSRECPKRYNEQKQQQKYDLNAVNAVCQHVVLGRSKIPQYKYRNRSLISLSS